MLEPGVVEVGERKLEYGALVVATGSSPAVPPVDGLDGVEFWTNREAVWAGEVPERLVVFGGGPVGVELAQFFHRMGSKVTIVESNDRLLARIDSEAGALLRQRFEDEGIDVRVDVKAERVEPVGTGSRVHLTSGETLDATRLLVATGRRPNVEDIGLEELDLEIGERGIEVDGRLRAGDGVWAIGDVAAVGLLTHLGKYQAWVAAGDIAGRDVVADYRALPAAVFTDPQVGTVGTTVGENLVTISYKVEGGRLSTYERPKRAGLVKLAADPERRVLVGALTVGPEAGEWLGQLTLAVRAEVALDVLLDTIQPYPTFSEAIFNALLELESALAT